MEMPRTNEAAQLVWIKNASPFSVVGAGFKSVLKTMGDRLHRGPEAPMEAPSVIVYCSIGGTGEEEEITSEVQELNKKYPDAAIVVLGAFANVSLARTALRAGADGFLHARMLPEQIARALKKVRADEAVLPRELLRGLVVEMGAQQRMPDLSKLDPCKVEILEMVEEGLSNAQISSQLYLSESTIKQHLRSAYKALGVNNRNQAANLVRRWRIGHPVSGKREIT